MARSSASEAVFAGWSVAWVAFVVAVFAWGIGFHGLGVLLHSLHETRGWSIAVISAAITTHFLGGAAIIVFLPEVHRAFGLAATTICGAAFTAAGIVGWSMASAPWQLFVVALISGGGWAVTSGAAINAMVAPWFDRDRPKAIGLAFNGASVAGIVFPPLLVQGAASIGLQVTAILVAIAVLLVVGSLAHFYLRKVPADLGLAADGGLAVMPRSEPAPVQRLSRSSLIRTREFQTLNAAFALALFAQVGLLSHLLTRVSPVFGASGAALAVSLTTISAVAGRTLLGWLIGDHDRRIAACGNFLVQSVGVGLICISDRPSAVLVGCALFGLGVGNVVSLPTLIAQKEFRSPDVGTVVALVVAINQAVFALAPAVLGTIRDVTASYTVPFVIGIAAQIVASFIVLVGRRHRAADQGQTGS